MKEENIEQQIYKTKFTFKTKTGYIVAFVEYDYNKIDEEGYRWRIEEINGKKIIMKKPEFLNPDYDETVLELKDVIKLTFILDDE